MRLRLSRFVHLAPVGEDRVLVIHAVTHLRLAVDGDLAKMISLFAEPQEVSEDVFGPGAFGPPDRTRNPHPPDARGRDGGPVGGPQRAARTRSRCLVAKSAAPGAGGRRALLGGARSLEDQRRQNRPASYGCVLFGDCDIQMESDFLRREALRRGVDLRVAATFPDDLRFAAEHAHDAIIIGALRARHLIAQGPDRAQPYRRRDAAVHAAAQPGAGRRSRPCGP